MTRPASPRAPIRVWTWPIAIGAVTAAGLVSGLVVDGPGDAGAWIGLALPLVVIGACLRRRKDDGR